MKSKIILSAITIVTLFSINSFAQTKVGFIDSKALLASLPEKAKADTIFANEIQTYKNEYQNLLKTEKDTVKIQKFLLSADSILNTEKSRLLTPMLNRIDSAIEIIATKNNYDIIFDSNNGSLLYRNVNKDDLTNQVTTQAIELKKQEDDKKKNAKTKK